MYTESVALMNTSGEIATFRHELKPLPLASKSAPLKLPQPFRNPSSFQATKDYILRGDLISSKQEMSIAFREVFKDIGTNKSEYKNDSTEKEQISRAFHLGEKLLLSNDNLRPKSRSKTTVTSHDIHKVSPCDSDFRQQYSSSASMKSNRHFTEDVILNSPNPTTSKEQTKYNSNSNAPENLEILTDTVKKGKRSRKRNSLSVKSKKGKHGRIFTGATTSSQDKQSSVPSQQNSHLTKPSRISSEPPNVLRKHEYVPCMSDIRSQRAVKSRLQAMEKEAHKKEEKRKEAHAKVEKQQLKDREKQTKVKQRREIYALNKIMTELENKRFVEFCQAKGLNKV